MSDGSPDPPLSTLGRWTSLVVVLISTAFLFVYLGGRDWTGQWMATRPRIDALLPTPLARIGVTAALVSLAVFYVVVLWPRRYRRVAHDRLILPLVLLVLAATGYIVAFTREAQPAALVLLAVVWLCAGALFLIAARVSPQRHSSWLRVPFSLALALSTLLLLDTVLATLPAWGEGARAFPRESVSELAIAIAVIVGGIAALRFHDVVCPLALALVAALAPFLGNATPGFATASWIAGGGLAAIAALAAVALSREPRDPRRPAERYFRPVPADARPAPEPGDESVRTLRRRRERAGTAHRHAAGFAQS